MWNSSSFQPGLEPMRWLFFSVVLFLPLGVGCSLYQATADWVNGVPSLPDAQVASASPNSRSFLPVPAGLSAAESAELRRIQREHAQLIASIPTPAPTPSIQELAEVAPVAARAALGSALNEFPAGLAVAPVEHEEWFDSTKGLPFYRPAGGDWSPLSLREVHPYREVFYYEHFPATVANFHDESIYQHLAREMAFEAADLLPVIGSPQPPLIQSIRANLGWQLRDEREPVINVWSTFIVLRDGFPHRFAVGGVNRLVPQSWEERGRLWEYLVVGEWLGPVVVERLQ